MGENDEFYTTDTEAYLVFELEDNNFNPATAVLTLENRNDGSLKNETVDVVDGLIEWEMPQRYIEHFGNWQGQLVYEDTKDGQPELYTSATFSFVVNAHIGDKKKPSLVEIENWEKFIADGTELIETWEDMEDLRQANEAQRQANEQGRVSAESVRVSNEAERISKDSERDSKIEAVEGLQADLISGAVDSAAVQQHVEERYGQLEEEYAPRLTDVTTQLAHTDNKLNLKGWELQNKKRKIKPMVTFVDDDAYRQVLTHLKPLSQQYDIPFVIAAISGRVENEVSYSLNADELRHLQNDLGWEISSHTVNHYNLGGLSDEVQEFELRQSKETLEAMGLNISTICYPYGGLNDKTHEFVRKYYRAGRTTDFRNQMNLTPIETYDLLVTPIGSWFDTWSGSPLPTDSLEFYKYQVDKAIEQKAWLIFMTHVGGNDQHDETQQHYLEETIKYVLEKNLDVVTLDQGMDLRGNLIDVGRYQRRDLSHEHFVVGADGSYSGSHLQNIFKYTMKIMELPWSMILSHYNYELYKHIQSEQSWVGNIFIRPDMYNIGFYH